MARLERRPLLSQKLNKRNVSAAQIVFDLYSCRQVTDRWPMDRFTRSRRREDSLGRRWSVAIRSDNLSLARLM